MAVNKEERIADEVVDQLLEGRDPATVFESGVNLPRVSGHPG
jgi:hypothetical protein